MLVLMLGLLVYSVFYPKEHPNSCTPLDRLSGRCIPAGGCPPSQSGAKGVNIASCADIDYDHTL